MKTEYRIIFTATFDTAAERDGFYTKLKTGLASVKVGSTVTRADMTRDEYQIQDVPTVTEKVI